MNHTPYNKMFGFIPEAIINTYLHQPTRAGWYIALATIVSLGKPFIDYIVNGIVESLLKEEDDFDEEDVMGFTEDLIIEFAKDPNYMMEFIDDYSEKTGNSLEFDQKMADDIAAKEKSEEVKETYTRDSKGRLRDSKGHFVKE